MGKTCLVYISRLRIIFVSKIYKFRLQIKQYHTQLVTHELCTQICVNLWGLPFQFLERDSKESCISLAKPTQQILANFFKLHNYIVQ